jgi:hypothetical protein
MESALAIGFDYTAVASPRKRRGRASDMPSALLEEFRTAGLFSVMRSF